MPFPEFADWKSPWDDSQEPFDAERARKYVYDVQKERETTKEELTTAKQTVTQLTSDRDALATKVTALEADGSDVTQLKSQLAELQTQLDQQQAATRQTWLDAVKTEFGLTDKQVKKLDGDDLEALRTDAIETFGEPTPNDDGEDDKDKPDDGDDDKDKPDPTPPARILPVGGPRRVRNLGDPAPNEPKRPSVEDVLAKIPL